MFKMHFNVKGTKSIDRSYNNILTFLEFADSFYLFDMKTDLLICLSRYTPFFIMRKLWLVIIITRDDNYM